MDLTITSSEDFVAMLSNRSIALLVPEILAGNCMLSTEDQLAVMIEGYKRANS